MTNWKGHGILTLMNGEGVSWRRSVSGLHSIVMGVTTTLCCAFEHH